MRGLIRSLAEHATVILSTHILQEVQAVCGRVIIINRGKLALDSAIEDLDRRRRLRIVTNGAPDIVEPLVAAANLAAGLDRLPAQGGAHAYGLDLGGHAPEEVAPRIARLLFDKGLDLIALHPETRDLETVFASIASNETAHKEAANA
jgi:ABC-2 type transport system ATP-binding protein